MNRIPFFENNVATKNTKALRAETTSDMCKCNTQLEKNIFFVDYEIAT